MEQIIPENLSSPSSRATTQSSEALVARLNLVEAELARVLRENYALRNQTVTDEQLKLLMQEQLEIQRDGQYGVSSERYKKPLRPEGPKLPPKPRLKKPSERYPNIPIREERIEESPLPACSCCGKEMKDSGMTEESEQLTVIPKKYEIVRQLRVKYRCTCQGTIVTAEAPPRIAVGSSYSDEMILDVGLSKYCDLIPIQRYAAMAGRGGLVSLPQQSLIETTHVLADFLSPVYFGIKRSLLQSRVLHADETPHRMLEGSEKKSWYLWGFSDGENSLFECHDTRSGDVASEILLKSSAQILVSDVYSGYGKALRLTNLQRKSENRPLIKAAYCNAHARRYFYQCFPKYGESTFYLDHYHEIYRLNTESKGQSPPWVLTLRAEMKVRFEEMRVRALQELPSYPVKNQYSKALRYFLGNWDGLTLFLGDANVPIDNNPQERLLRSPVVGRKTWYGTHSERGALTAAVMFTIVESCKLNEVNPREFFAYATKRIHVGESSVTPAEFKRRCSTAAVA